MGVALRTTGSGQRRLVFLPARGDRQGRGMEVMDAYLASPSGAGQCGTRGVGVDVNLIEAHPQGIRGADDAHRVADAFQFTAQRARLSGSGVKQVHDLELPGRGRLHSITRPGDPMRGAGHEIDEHLMGDLGARLRKLHRPVRTVIQLGSGLGVDRVRQAREHEHQGRAAGVHGAMAEPGGLHDALLGAEGGGRADRRDACGRGRLGLLQGRARSRSGIPGDRQQSSPHRSRHGGPCGVRDALVGVDDLDWPQSGGVGPLSADVGERSQRLRDQEAGVAACATDRAISCSPGDLDEISAGRQETYCIAGGAHSEQNIGAGVRIRDRKNIERIDERARDLFGSAHQTQPIAQNGGGKSAHGSRGWRLAAHLPCHAAFSLAAGGSGRPIGRLLTLMSQGYRSAPLSAPWGDCRED